MQSNTVAAVSTPMGDGGISVIRISGDDAFNVAEKVFFSASGRKITDQKGYTALFGEVKDEDEKIDDAVALVFRAPKSYTGENVVEISVHGGRFVSRKVLRLLLNSGAQSAGPGEFTKRAFLNGKIDLTQAESIMGIISAQSECELKISTDALGGRISKQIDEIKSDLVAVSASIAAYTDYPDEDLPELSVENFGAMLLSAENKIETMLKSYDAGRILREGIETAIVGKPNVGKSTLMNRLSGCKRSLVTDIAGTTRDVVEDTVMVGEVMLKLADTAGIRETDDIVEEAGVALAKQRMISSELVLAVFDSSSEWDENDEELLRSIKDKKAIIIINKSDRGGELDLSRFIGYRTIIISAKTGDGMKELTQAVEETAEIGNLSADTAVLVSERQRDCASKAYQSIKEAHSALLEGVPTDVVGVCIDDALSAIYSLTGERATNTVTEEIFRRFCVGK